MQIFTAWTGSARLLSRKGSLAGCVHIWFHCLGERSLNFNDYYTLSQHLRLLLDALYEGSLITVSPHNSGDIAWSVIRRTLQEGSEILWSKETKQRYSWQLWGVVLVITNHKSSSADLYCLNWLGKTLEQKRFTRRLCPYLISLSRRAFAEFQRLLHPRTTSQVVC